MTVALGDYLDSFSYEINPPGQNVFPNMTDDEALGRLIDSFWELRLSGLDFLSAWTCDDSGNITPLSNAPAAAGQVGFTIPSSWYTDDGTPDLGREVIQAIVLFAGYRVALTAAQNLASLVRYQAGPVSSEVQKSAQLQQSVLKGLVAKIDIVLTRLSDLGTTSVMVLDQVMEKTISEAEGYNWWTR